MATEARTGLTLGPLLAAGGAVLLFVSLFLNYLAEEGEGENTWKTFEFYDIVVLLVILVALAAAVVSILHVPVPVDAFDVLKFAGTVALVIMGFAIVEVPDVGAGVGAWLGVLSSIAIIAGGVLGDRVPISAGGPAGAGAGAGYGGGQLGGAPGGAGYGGAEATEVAGAQAGQPAADWYPDPKGEARLRYWDGTQWTDQTAD